MKDISRERLYSILPRNDLQIEVFEVLDSTSSQLRRMIDGGLEKNTLVIAKKQTAGRGRCGKSFYSEDEKGLYFSIGIFPKGGKNFNLITPMAAVAVAEGIKRAIKKDPQIKWVNDIFLNGKKVCGILTEAVTDTEKGVPKAFIIGIGINITTESFPEEIRNIAASLGEDVDRGALIGQIYGSIESFFNNTDDTSFMDKYREYSLVLGKEVHFSKNGADYVATAKAINNNGELVVITSSGEELVLNSGEISVKL